MTARTMLLSEIQRYYVDRENVTPSHYGMGMDSRGEYVLYADHEAERNRLLDEIDRLKAMVPKWVEYFSDESDDLFELEWTCVEESRSNDYGLALFVPPIPLPENEEKGRE